jgi:hypothetical protein
MRGRRAKVLSGRLTRVAKPLYGFATEREHGTPYVQPECPAVVLAIFEWVDQGIGLREVIRPLNRDGVHPPSDPVADH